MSTECYCGALRLAARKTTAIYDAALKPAGINVAQYSLLRCIERAEMISLSDLARGTGLDRSTIGRNVRVLERLGLITGAAADDRRESCVTLARGGAETLKTALPLWRKAQAKIEQSISQDAAQQLRSLLATL